MNAFQLCMLCCTLSVATAFADEPDALPKIVTVDGVTYSNVSWRTVTPGTVTIFHQTGVASIQLAKLPSELRQHFGYDPQKAADYLQADSITQAEQAKRIVEAQTVRARQQHQAALEQQAAQEQASQASPSPVPASRSNQNQPLQSTTVVKLDFSNVDFQPPSNGMSCAALLLTSGTRATVLYDASAQPYLDFCASQRGVWNQQERNLAQSSASYSQRYWWEQMHYDHKLPTFVAYGVSLGPTAYRLVGNSIYQEMGGSITYIWR
ncbi:MAG TPA: hypothetical protein VMP11_15460 [Verrucomicrobiae bacterium]|nr:hypothetical protein [Verrucomicrobiae bacterium]